MLDSHGYPADWSLVWLGWASLRHRLAALPLPFRSRRFAGHRQFWTSAHHQVHTASQSFAHAFEALSGGLEQLLTSTEDCLATTRQAISSGITGEIHAGNQGSFSLLEAANLASRTLDFGQHLQSLAPDIRQQLAQLDRLSHDILRRERAIADFMRPAEVVQVLLRIECTGLDEVARAPLEALSLEIASACARVGQTMEQEFLLVDQARLSIEQLVLRARRLDQYLQQAIARRQQLSAEMELIHSSAVDQSFQNEAVSAAAAAVQSTLGRLVEAMQFQDIVAQRWQHVEQALAVHAQSDLNAPSTRWLLALQAAQLHEANTEIAAALARIDDALNAVASVEQSLAAQLAAASRDTRRQHLYVQLHTILFEIWDIAQENSAQLRDIDGHIAPLLQLSGKIGFSLGQVAYEMRLIALNAQVQAARFGVGTGLEVLAEALRRIADSMGEGGLLLDADSHQIAALAAALQQNFQQLQQQADATLALCNAEIPGVTARLTAEEKHMVKHLSLASQQSLAVAQCRASLQSALAATLAPLEELSQLAAAANQLAGQHYLSDPAVQACGQAALLDQEASRYTMFSETQVLQKLAGNSPGPPPASPVTGELDLF